MTNQVVEDLVVEEIPFQTADDLLDSLSLPIMKRSIMDQITSEFNTSRDFLSVVLDKFMVINENGEDDATRGIRDEMVDWANDLILAIVRRYNLAYNNINEESLQSLEILEALYNFFILDKKKNVTKFFIQYIDINKKEITERMGLNTRGGDITTLANKRKNISKNNIPILSNLYEVIKYVANDAGITSYDMMKILNDGDYYIEKVLSYFEDDMLIGDFYTDYISNEVGSYMEDISMDLRSAIRAHLSNV